MNSNGSFSLLIFLLPLLLIGWLFWTQNKRMKQMRQFSSALSVGDEVVTSSGIFGTVRRLDDSTAWLEIAEGVTIRVDRRAVAMKQDAATGTTGQDSLPGDDAPGSTPTGQ
ncbi:preprotein translocase subunit YajC [Intrasporangium sp. YIM S08009]|uniref:preprotein translocase subunit YajC n=1 Tax=Intrasporangium zincisolvens TaxID=3080018 RepID=UPI002B059045|nr:preprotein translocase subunit YajC [Intrasporangium sp. YIM S08009]